MTENQRLEEIREWLNQKPRFGLADALRFAAWQMMEEIPGYTSGDFARDCTKLGLHAQGARNRFNEARKNLIDTGMLPA